MRKASVTQQLLKVHCGAANKQLGNLLTTMLND